MKKLLPVFQNRVSQLFLLVLLVVSQFAFAQPTVLGTQVVNGSYTTYNLSTVGGFKQVRLQATSGAAVSTRNWEFATGTAASANYTTNWRPYTSNNTLSANTFIPTSFANGAKYNTSSGGTSGLLPAITANNYYTFNVSNLATADNVMSLLETTFNPVTIASTTRYSNTVNIVTSATPNAAENIYVRYTTNAFASSTIVQATGSGTTWSATIPATGSITYYIYTSNRSKAAIDGDVATYGQGVHDMSTLSLLNNGQANYSFTATAVIASNEITGTNPGQVAGNYTTGQYVVTNATATGISKGAGITGNAANDRYNATGWSTGALDTTDYFEFTITPNSSYRLNFTNFTYTGQVSSGGGSYSFRSSLDGYTSDIGTPTATGATISLSAGTYQNVTSGITFRLYRYATTGGTWSVNDYTFNGTVDLIPAAPFLVVSGATAHGTSCPTVSTAPITYTITNTGTVTATGVTVVSNNAQFVVSGLSSTTIASGGGTATYVVTFTPSAAGAQSATVTVASATSGSNSPTSSLTGTGSTPVTAAVSSSAATSVSNTTATLNGNVTALGVCPNTTQKGFVYSVTATNSNPLNGGTGVTTTPVAGLATGAYSLPLTSLATGTSYSFKAYVYDGTTYTYGAATTFTTTTPAVSLAFASVPASGSTGVNLAAFTVEARRADNSVDTNFTGNITISKASGPGTLSGTLTVAAVAGVATFSSAQFDTVGTVTLAAAAIGLTGTTSSNIVINLAPVSLGNYPFTGTSCSAAALAPSGVAANVTFSQASATAETCNSNVANVYSTSASWGTTFNAARYREITVTPAAGFYLDLSTVTFDILRTTAGATNGTVRSSIDNYATDLITPYTITTTSSLKTITLGASHTGLTTAVKFRFYGWGGNSTGDLRMDNLTVNGNVLCVDPTAFNVTGGATICATGSGTPIGLSGSQSGISYQLKIGGVDTGAPVAGTGAAISFGNQTVAGTYTVQANNTNGTCTNTLAMTGSAVIISNPASVGGTVTGENPVCTGTNSTTLTLTGNTGTIQWQSSTDNATFTDIAGQTASTYTATNLTVMTYYRAVVTSGVCSSANSNTVTVTVSPTSVAGTVTGDATVCIGTNNTTLTLTGSTGAIQWQSSTDNATFTDISGANSATYNATNLTATAYYRAVVTSGVCSSATSNTATITVVPAAVAGSVSADQAICGGFQPANITLTGSSGSIQWQSSTDNVTFTDISGQTSATLSGAAIGVLTQTTYFRAVVSSGVCPAATSATVTVTIASTTWNGAVWSNGVPDSTKAIIIDGNLTVNGDLSGCTMTVNAGFAVTVTSGNNITLNGVLTVDPTATFTIQNNANLIQSQDVDNSGAMTVERDSNPLMRLDYTLWSSPVDGQNLLDFSSLTVTNRFYVYNPATNVYNTIAPSNDFTEGTGYLIRMPDNHPTTPTVWNGSFTGEPHNGNLDLTVTNNTFNAVGNPYPSTIDADLFISTNNLTEPLYFWRKTNNATTTSYATYTLAGGAGTSANAGDPNGLVPNGVIQIGQGFIAKSTSTTLSFNNNMRIADNNNQFFRASDIERNRIWVNLSNADGVFSQTMVAYMTGATQGIDAAIDGLYFNDSQVALTSLIGTTEYAVQGRALPFVGTDVVPMGFKVLTAGTYSISLDHVDGLFLDPSQPILLKDNLTNVEYDLRSGNYTFASAAGVFNDRFEIIYQTTLATTNPDANANSIVAYKKGLDIVIQSANAAIDHVTVFDLQGRQIASKQKVNGKQTVVFAGTQNQVLLVKVTTQDQKQQTIKIVN